MNTCSFDDKQSHIPDNLVSQTAYFLSKYYVDNSFAQAAMDLGIFGYSSYHHDLIDKIEAHLYQQTQKGVHNINDSEKVKFRKNPKEGIFGAKKIRAAIKSNMSQMRKGIDDTVRNLSKKAGIAAAAIELYDLNRNSNAKDILRSLAKVAIIGGLTTTPVGLGCVINYPIPYNSKP